MMPTIPVVLMFRSRPIRGWVAGLAVTVVLAGALRSSGQEMMEKWSVRYDGTTDGLHEGRGVVVSASGDVAAAGASASAGNGLDFYTVKYRGVDGVRSWDDRYDGTGDDDDAPVAVAVDAAGNVVVAGGSIGSSAGLDLLVRKYNGATGALVWNARYNAPSDGEDAAMALALDSEGNVVVTGRSEDAGAGFDAYTAKYAAANGARLWFRRYNGAGNGDDIPAGVAVAPDGSVAMTATTEGAGGSLDLYTAKYHGATNQLLWEKTYDGPGGGDDAAVAVAADAGGNAVVAGTVSNNGNPDIFVAKLRAEDGHELWSKFDNGTANGDDAAAAIAVDAAGDVVVVGTSDNGRNFDLVIAKFAGADGARLWSDRYNGPGDADDVASGVAVDAQGNVVVSGTSVGSGGTADIYTAAYDGRTGRRLWSERWDGPRRRDDVTGRFGLALGPLNTVAVTGSTQLAEPPPTKTEMVTLVYAPDLADADVDGLPDGWEVTFWATTAGHGPNDDADGDGVNELTEYAFGMNPAAPDADRLPAPVLEGGFLTISLAKRPGVTLSVETSGSLAAGSWSTATTVVLVDTLGLLKVRDTVAVSAGEARFLRVRVTTP